MTIGAARIEKLLKFVQDGMMTVSDIASIVDKEAYAKGRGDQRDSDMRRIRHKMKDIQDSQSERSTDHTKVLGMMFDVQMSILSEQKNEDISAIEL